MQFIDTHAHLYDEEILKNLPTIMQRSIDAGVTKIFLPNCDSSTINDMKKVVELYPENCFAMMGVHPCYIKDNYEQELKIAEQELATNKYFAVGEVGLDYHWDLAYVEQQKKALAIQTHWANDLNLPLIIHSRKSTYDCIKIIKQNKKADLRGVFHCFSGSLEEAKEIIDMGFYLGIGGVVTYKNSKLDEVIKQIGLQHLVLETDAPYLSPVPHRGKNNEPSYVSIVAQKIADTFEMSIEEIARVTTENAEKLFG